MSQAEKNRRTGAIASLVVHLLLLVFCLFVLAWTAPDPPIPEYGIEFSLGNDVLKESFVDDQLTTDTDDQVDQSPPQNSSTSESKASAVPTNQEAVKESQENRPSSEAMSSTEDIHSPDVTERASDTKKVESAPAAKSKTELKSAEDNTNNDTGTGDSESAKEAPTVDERALYRRTSGGSPGGNKGASLDMRGWQWDRIPKPNDQSNESGKIIFQIVVDEEGEIIQVKTLEKTISPLLEKLYKDAIMELTFSRTSDNRSVASQSTGKITFIIQSK